MCLYKVNLKTYKEFHSMQLICYFLQFIVFRNLKAKEIAECYGVTSI